MSLFRKPQIKLVDSIDLEPMEPSVAYIPEQLQDIGTGNDIRVLIMEFLRSNITEEATDEWIRLLKNALGPRLPWFVPMSFVGYILDYLVPDLALNTLDDLLRKVL